MRASVSVGMPDLHLQPGKKILSLDGFVKTMRIIDPIAANEADTGYENPRFVRKYFKKTGSNLLKVCYLYNVSRQRSRQPERISLYHRYDETWDNSGYVSINSNSITINSGGSLTTGGLTIANSGTGTWIGGLDTTTNDPSYTTYRITGNYY